MSVLHVRIVDFDLQIISYPLVLSDLNLEFGKAVKIAPQDHAISAKIPLELFRVTGNSMGFRHIRLEN